MLSIIHNFVNVHRFVDKIYELYIIKSLSRDSIHGDKSMKIFTLLS